MDAFRLSRRMVVLGLAGLLGTGGNVFTYRHHSFDVNAVAWSPDGARITSVSGDGTLQVWKAP